MSGAMPPLQLCVVMTWRGTASPDYRSLLCAGSSPLAPCFVFTVRRTCSLFLCVSHLDVPRVTYPRYAAIGSRQGIETVASIPGTSSSDRRMISTWEPGFCDGGSSTYFMVHGFPKMIVGGIRAWRSCDLVYGIIKV